MKDNTNTSTIPLANRSYIVKNSHKAVYLHWITIARVNHANVIVHAVEL